MNKTIDIHLAQTLFSLDEQAYIILKKYLERLEFIFIKTEGGKDILEDIEVRISELFTEIKTGERYVISVKEVEQVIETLGSPEDLAGEDAETYETKSNYSEPKKLFRDTDDRFIGGVAGGLSHYIGIDSLWVRLILLILFFSSIGGVVLVYILLWIIVPEALTTADKLKMKGEPVNVSNIKKKIKEELDQVSNSVKDVDYENLGNQLKKKSKSFSDFLLKLIKGLFRIAGLFIGIMFLLVSSVSLLGLFIGTILGSVFTAMIPNELLQLGISMDLPVIIIGLFAFLIAGIPFIFLFTLGLNLLGNNGQVMGRTSKLILLGIWVFAVIALSIFGIIESKAFAVTSKKSELIEWDNNASDTLKIYLNEHQKYSETITLFNNLTIVENELGESFRLDNNVRLYIQKSKNDQLGLSIEKIAKGWSQKKAIENAGEITYAHDLFDDQLVLDNFWISPIKSKTNPEKVIVNLSLPEGKYVYIDSDFGDYLAKKIKNNQEYYRKRIAGHLWKMEDGELVCQDCESVKAGLHIDENGLELNVTDKDASLEVTIDENGLQIKQNEE